MCDFICCVCWCLRAERDECLLSAAAKSEKRADVPVPRIGPFDVEVLGGFGL